MLISILANLMLEGGGPIPPIIPSHGGGGEIDFGLQSGIRSADEAALRRKKILDQDEEDWILFIHNLIVSSNLN